MLAFYQERLANEAYLGTATEPRSVRELVRAIGYELTPGLAAETALAFTVQDSRGSPIVAANARLMAGAAAALVEAGTKVQSVPGPLETAQMFETVETIEARAEWNALKPLRFAAQRFGGAVSEIYFAGLSTGLQSGDPLLLVGDERLKWSESERWDLRHVAALETNATENWTRVTLDQKPGWSKWADGEWKQVEPAAQNVKVYAFRQRAALFGNNAPDWLSMPNDTVKAGYVAQVLGDAVVRAHCSLTANWLEEYHRVYLVVSTAAAGLSANSGYFTSLVAESGHWEAVGLNSIYPEKEGFRIAVSFDGGNIVPLYAVENHWTLHWLGLNAGRTSGSTLAGATDWRQDRPDDDTVYVDVDTSTAAFTSTPLYFTSLSGAGHSQAFGITTIHRASSRGFRVYVSRANYDYSPSGANALDWQVNWFAVEPGQRCGVTEPGQWRALEGGGIYVDVDTSAAAFTHTPSYFTTLRIDDNQPVFVKGVNSIDRRRE